MWRVRNCARKCARRCAFLKNSTFNNELLPFVWWTFRQTLIILDLKLYSCPDFPRKWLMRLNDDNLVLYWKNTLAEPFNEDCFKLIVRLYSLLIWAGNALWTMNGLDLGLNTILTLSRTCVLLILPVPCSVCWYVNISPSSIGGLIWCYLLQPGGLWLTTASPVTDEILVCALVFTLTVANPTWSYSCHLVFSSWEFGQNM